MPPAIVKLFGNDVDVSGWMDNHPGGRKLLKIFENRDATQQFVAIHKGDSARSILKKLPQKKSEVTPNYTAAETEFNEIVAMLQPKLSKVNVLYEATKLSYVLGCFFGGYALCYVGHKHVGLTLMCLGIYQAGWVGHDYSHRSIFKSPAANNAMSDFLGWVVQGYTDLWWKSRHNTHHMTTNEVGNDPDIRTEPVLHFFDAATAMAKAHSKTHVPAQNFFFLFILALLDLFWRYESIQILFKSGNKKHQLRNLLGLGVHYCMLAALLVLTDVTPLDLLCLSLAKGFMTAAVVFANHYPEDRMAPPAAKDGSPQPGLFEQTLRTSRNTTGFFWAHYDHSSNGPGADQDDVDAASGKYKIRIGNGLLLRLIFNECVGYLSMQIEHHCVPTWPSGNLMQLRPYVRALARKHNLPYKETSIAHALWDNIVKLSDVSLEQLKHVQ